MWHRPAVTWPEREHHQGRSRCGDRVDRPPVVPSLVIGEPVKAADVEYQHVPTVDGYVQVCRVLVEEPDVDVCFTCMYARFVQGFLLGVDAGDMPTALRQLDGMASGAAADVECTATFRDGDRIQKAGQLSVEAVTGVLPRSDADLVGETISEIHRSLFSRGDSNTCLPR